MNYLTKFCIIIILLIALFGCEKNNTEPPIVSDLLKIDSLICNRDTIKAWTDTAYFKVYVSGENYEVRWLANHGTLRGEGEEIIYFAGECCVGFNTVYCTVFDSIGELSDSLNITVTSYYE